MLVLRTLRVAFVTEESRKAMGVRRLTPTLEILRVALI
jgi:hypothetical protein